MTQREIWKLAAKEFKPGTCAYSWPFRNSRGLCFFLDRLETHDEITNAQHEDALRTMRKVRSAGHRSTHGWWWEPGPNLSRYRFALKLSKLKRYR